MRRSVPIIAAALLLNGGGLSLAQTGAAPGMAAAVPSATHARPSPPAFAGATALGTIPQGLGTSAAVGGSANRQHHAVRDDRCGRWRLDCERSDTGHIGVRNLDHFGKLQPVPVPRPGGGRDYPAAARGRHHGR